MDKHLQNNDWYLIINPEAGGGKVKKIWSEIRTLFIEHEIQFEYAFTEHPMHALELVHNAVEKGFRHFIGIGGDGTNNEVINGILKQKIVPASELLYTLFPIGTGNDWGRYHNIPKKTRKWFAKMSTAQIKSHDAGLVLFERNKMMQSRFFVNVAGMAYDAFVLRTAKQHGKPIKNQWAYLMLVFKCLFLFKASPIKLLLDEKSFEENYYTIHIGICKYSGGGMQFVPHAVHDNGKLALMTAIGITPLNIILNFPKLYGGRVKNYKKATLQEVSNILVEMPDTKNSPPTFIEVDGELIGKVPAEFSIQEKAFRVLVP